MTDYSVKSPSMELMTVSADWIISVTLDDILRGQAANPAIVRAKKPNLLAVAERALIEGQKLLHPVTLTQFHAVTEHRHERIGLEGGLRLTGPLVARELAGAVRLAAVTCTIGGELEKSAARQFDRDPLFALALDGLGNAAVEILAQKVCSQIGETAQRDGLSASTPLSPGSPEWPVEIGQPQVFALVDINQAGIRLTSTGMMIPQKSISFVVGLGNEMARTDLCSLCSLNETCRFRHD